MQSLLGDARMALRRLSRSPGFSLFAICSLALGIGVSTAIYSAVRTLLWMPLGVPDEQALVAVTSKGARTRVMSWVDFDEFRARQTTASSVAAAVSIHTALSTGSASRTVFGEAISGNYFVTIGITPRLGRLIDARDEATSARVIVVSEGFWRGALNGDVSVIGRTVRVGGTAFELIGVAAGHFHGLDPFVPSAAWVPATAVRANPQPFEISPNEFVLRGYRAFAVWARLRPGTGVAQVASETTVLGQQLDAAFPAAVDRTRSPVAPTRDWSASAGTRDPVSSDSARTIVFMIMTALAVVLLVTCTNLANLSLARGTARSQETAVRTALGASRGRLLREQIIESLLLVAAGSAGATVVLYQLVHYLTTDLPIGKGIALAFQPEVDATVLGAGIAASVVAVLVVGLWPALASTGKDVRLRLGAGAGATPPRWGFHRNLSAWQVCGSVALLLVAVMSARVVIGTGSSLQRPRYEQLAIAQIDFRLNGVDEGRARELTAAIVSAARHQPGIERVSASNGSPSSLFGSPVLVGTMDDPTGARSQHTITGQSSVEPGFLELLGVGILRGRGFTDRDDAGAPKVAIITEQLARDLFRTTDVVGREMRVGSAGSRGVLDVVTIVGVARDVTTLATIRPDRIVFTPLAQRYEWRAPMMILARGADPAATVATLRSVVRQVDPALAVSAAGTADVLLAGPLFLLRVIALLAAWLGALALVLAMAGLFGVLSHVVERRTREIGIRLAVGAARRDVVNMVLLDGLRPVGKGLVLGLVIGLGVRMAIRGQVFTTIAAWDPVEFTVLPAIFAVAALVACWLPATRASRVDPNVALRDQ
jgi:predicted permease